MVVIDRLKKCGFVILERIERKACCHCERIGDRREHGCWRRSSRADGHVHLGCIPRRHTRNGFRPANNDTFFDNKMSSRLRYLFARKRSNELAGRFVIRMTEIYWIMRSIDPHVYRLVMLEKRVVYHEQVVIQVPIPSGRMAVVFRFLYVINGQRINPLSSCSVAQKG
jgi:hypothetical protein